MNACVLLKSWHRKGAFPGVGAQSRRFKYNRSAGEAGGTPNLHLPQERAPAGQRNACVCCAGAAVTVWKAGRALQQSPEPTIQLDKARPCKERLCEAWETRGE